MLEPLRTAHPRLPLSRRFLPRSRLLNRTSVHPREVDEAMLHIRADQFHADPIADVETLEPTHHSALDRRADNAHPDALLRGPSDDPFKPLADSMLQEHRGGRFLHLPLHLLRVVLLLGTMPREDLQVGYAIGSRTARHGGLEESLRYQVRKASVRGGRVRVGGDG